ncbi:uncharacterized protein TRAVEDRAFT_53040 [Trametes versicolor FP-101664 SS1]|uniref:uncharacterized protein n=1 Tax=Trametes versicolor (strain FP-101664) TaxID=717944 RepID=UPI0004623457|nr:uncharacterized protein TRAVEDRAFT_53040 [Trametes versicolor FP-101664 SS1]EIW52597.1 hypothetical protein TRAVEDRAFT_53040 [Trametes versicolor FP-101664 SS1]
MGSPSSTTSSDVGASADAKAPHPALQNQDILLAIFSQARARAEHEQVPHDSVAKCARVCQAFRDPALQVLWERLSSILPLLRLLAPNFRNIDGGHEAQDGMDVRKYNAYVLREIPDAKQWARFCEYARRVRVLHHDGTANAVLQPRYGRRNSTVSYHSSSSESEPDPDADSVHESDSQSNADVGGASDPENGGSNIGHEDEEDPGSVFHEDMGDGPDQDSSLFDLSGATHIFPSVWYHLRCLAAGQPLLPTLRELDWTTEPDQTEIFMLVGPCLKRLHLRFNPLHPFTDHEYDAALPLIVRNVISLAPSVKHFAITTRAISTVRSVLPEVHRMSKLRTLELDAGPATGFAFNAASLRSARLDTLEDLESLSIGFRVLDDALDVDATIALPALRALKVVDYAGNIEAYKLFDVQALRSLEATICLPVHSPDTYRALSAAFARRFPAVSSIVLALRSLAPASATLPTVAFLLLDVIQPLLGLSDIRVFSFLADGGARVSFPSADPYALLRAWPLLSVLSIIAPLPGSTPPSLVPEMPGVWTLVYAARNHVELRILHLNCLKISQEELDVALQVLNGPDTHAGSQESALRTGSKLEVLTVAHMTNDRGTCVRPNHGRLLSRFAVVVHKMFPRLDVERCRKERPTWLAEEHWAWKRVLDEVLKVRGRMDV